MEHNCRGVFSPIKRLNKIFLWYTCLCLKRCTNKGTYLTRSMPQPKDGVWNSPSNGFPQSTARDRFVTSANASAETTESILYIHFLLLHKNAEMPTYIYAATALDEQTKDASWHEQVWHSIDALPRALANFPQKAKGKVRSSQSKVYVLYWPTPWRNIFKAGHKLVCILPVSETVLRPNNQ